MRRTPSLGSKPGLEVAEMMSRAVVSLSRKERARNKRKKALLVYRRNGWRVVSDGVTLVSTWGPERQTERLDHARYL